ncbi:MAG: hypothetical protein Q4C85_08015 [Actinomyces sp.]|uniref:hypothetical protein n=1 Tax=Actinomyces sp. TaxID=29317 RepID=UPI0026DD74E1|nr:hypothetical protein [Actinomyces sp.]MDO4243687.1 hypothetical protein [Actinomyces sp.]
MLPDDRPFIVMERCDGGSLVDLVAGGPVAPADAVPLVRAAASALGAAQAYGFDNPEVSVLGPSEVEWTVNGNRGLSCVPSSA